MGIYINDYEAREFPSDELTQFCQEASRPNLFQQHVVELIGVFKSFKGDDPFVDDDPDRIHSMFKEGLQSLGEISYAATCQMALQGRTHVFQFMVIEDC